MNDDKIQLIDLRITFGQQSEKLVVWIVKLETLQAKQVAGKYKWKRLQILIYEQHTNIITIGRMGD